MDRRHTLVEAFARRPLLRRLLRPIVAFVALVIAGTGGFSALAGVGAVDAAFWLLDPTSIELHYREHAGPERAVKSYAIVVLSGLVLAGLWIGETFLSAAFGGQIRDELDTMKREREISELNEHVVVCGYGTFGRTIAARLQENGRDVVVVENQESQFRRALEAGVPAIEGDARREEILGEAGAARASTVVGAIDDSHVNIQIAIAATRLSPTAKLIVRVGDQMDEALARRAGADEVVIPEVVSGQQVCTDL